MIRADLFGDTDDADDVNTLFGKANISSNQKANNVFGDDEQGLFGGSVKSAAKTATSGKQPEKSLENLPATEKSPEKSHVKEEEKNPLFEPKSDDEDLFGGGEKAAETYFGEDTTTKKPQKVKLWDEVGKQDGLLADIEASREERNLGGLFLPDEAVEQRGDGERKRHDSVEADLLHVDGDETLDKFADKTRQTFKAVIVGDDDDLFASVPAGKLDDDLFSMASGGGGGEGALADGFDFAAYINTNTGSNSKSGGSSNLFDD